MSDVTATTYEQDSQFDDYFALLKPRVMRLVVFTAAVGLLVAPVGINPVLGFASILFIALGAGASGALNMWWDADIDAIMKRTVKRPVPDGRVTPKNAMIFGLWLSVISVGMLALTANWFAAGLLAFTIFFYAVIYSMWLKRWTPQNIVIGGAAGAFPPMVGWAVATGGVSVESVAMFLLIFMWTPPHFWALSLFMNDDYSKAGVPMLSVTHGTRVTRNNILGYTVVLFVLAIGTAFTGIGGPIYLITALVLNVLFLIGAVKLWKRTDADADADKYGAERKFFRLSLVYLFASFAALLGDAALRKFDLLNAWPVMI
jgi:protoheme IX farnesyltransferase